MSNNASQQSVRKREQTFVIRIHENRSKWDWYGALQWKPVGGKTWYYLDSARIAPVEMHDVFHGKWIQEMLDYEVAVEVRGWWNREEKTMHIVSIRGAVG